MNIWDLMIRDKQFRHYLKTHYRFYQVQSMVPVYRQNKLIFPVETVIEPKKLSIIDKLLYYFNDLKMWMQYGKR